MANNFLLLVLGGCEELLESSVCSGVRLLKDIASDRNIAVMHLDEIPNSSALVPADVAWHLDYVVVCGITSSEKLFRCSMSLQQQGLKVIVTIDSTEIDISRELLLDCLEKNGCQLALTGAVAALLSQGNRFVYAYQKADVAASVVVFFRRSSSILLVERKQEPFKGCLALPGGFLRPLLEDLPSCAVRELAEETGIRLTPAELRGVSVRSNPCRDTRGHVIDYGYFAVIQPEREAAVLQSIKAMDDAKSVVVLPLSLARYLPLAADHNAILEDAMKICAKDRWAIFPRFVQSVSARITIIQKQASATLGRFRSDFMLLVARY